MADFFEPFAEREIKELPEYVFLIEYDKYQKKYCVGLKNIKTKETVYTQKFNNHIQRLTDEQEELFIYKLNKKFNLNEKENMNYLRERTRLNINWEKYLVKEDEDTEELNDYLERLKEDENTPDKTKICEYLKRKYVFYVDRDDPNLIVYVWNKNLWKANAECIVLNELTKMFGSDKIKTRKDEVIEYLKGYGQDTSIIKKPPNMIVFLNGLLDVKSDEFIAPTPEYFCLNVIPFNYDKNAECPKWLKFEKDIHNPEDLDFIQEFFGYFLYTSYPVKSFLICIGNGNNGKTTELTVLSNILGENNITSVSLQEINYSEYASSELENKLGNISDDISNKKISLTSKLKILSDGGRVSTRRIYEKHHQFINYAKLMSSSNEPPEITDDVDAIWERLKAISYPYQFVNNPDPTNPMQKQAINKDELLEILMEEAPGIINWMITGLTRLIANKYVFTYNYSTSEVRKYYRRKSNPVVSWISEELHYNGNDVEVIFKDDIYGLFLKWAEYRNIKAVPSINKFFKILHGENIESTQSREYDRRRVYIGYECHSVTSKSFPLILNDKTNNSIEDYNSSL